MYVFVVLVVTKPSFIGKLGFIDTYISDSYIKHWQSCPVLK